MPTLEQNIIREEYNAISDDIYAALFTSSQLIDEYAQWLKTALLKNIFQTKEQKAHVVRFLAKLQAQRELLAMDNDKALLESTQKASVSFASKTKTPTSSI